LDWGIGIMPIHSVDNRYRYWIKTDTAAEAVVVLLSMVAIVFGGGPRGKEDLVVHIASLPVLLLALLRLPYRRVNRAQFFFLCWIAAVIGVILLQLLPLPIAIVSYLPQRAILIESLQHAGVSASWLPITLDIWGSVRALIAFVVFAAVWFLVGTLPYASRIRLIKCILIFVCLAALFGFAQVINSKNASLRFYALHHTTGAIGFFANRNHFSSFVVMVLPFAFGFAWMEYAKREIRGMIFWAGVVIMLLLAVALSFSRAGISLGLLATSLCIIVLWAQEKSRIRYLLPVIILAPALLIISHYAWQGISQRLTQDIWADLRWQYYRNGLDVFWQYMPWGSGLGSFAWVYAPFEPVEEMVNVYAANAHNDVLQLAIEAGLFGILLMLWFAILLITVIVKNIRNEKNIDGGRYFIGRMSSISLLIPLMHSFADYPFRTLSIVVVYAVIFGFSFSIIDDRNRRSNALNDMKIGAPLRHQSM
jgi:O-antigen ligase